MGGDFKVERLLSVQLIESVNLIFRFQWQIGFRGINFSTTCILAGENLLSTCNYVNQSNQMNQQGGLIFLKNVFETQY